jgi:integrase
MRRRLPKYCSEFKDRHGKIRVRFRRAGYASYYFKATAWSEEFMREYEACMAGSAAPATVAGLKRSKRGSISALIAEYYQSPEFLGLGAGTQRNYRGIIERFRNEHGQKAVKTLERRHIKGIIGKKSATPAAANNLLDRLKALMAFAIDNNMRRGPNPAEGIKGFPSGRDGYHTWTDAEIAQFEAKWPIGTMPRLAMALMLYTGQRRSDAVKMSWDDVTDGMIFVRQEKTTRKLDIPIHPDLARVLARTPRDRPSFLETSFGLPFAAAGFGNWFRERCDEAGLPKCTAHGLRKAASRRLAEAGCSNQQIKSITGHKTDKEVSRYTEAADQKRLARQAMKILQASELANRSSELDKKG